MKTYFKMVAIIATMCMAASCENLDEPTPEEWEEVTYNYTRKFTFTVKGDFTNPTFTRSNDYMMADGVEMTDLWVVDVVDGEIKQMVHQTPSDAMWGMPSMKLELGTHHIMFLASRGSYPNYADGVVTWYKPMDSFFKDYEVTVVKTSNGNRSVTLDRCATKLQLVIEDEVPEVSRTVTVIPQLWYTGWNMITGEPVESTNYSIGFNVEGTKYTSECPTLNVWSLSGNEEWMTNINVVSHDSNEKKIADVTIEDAPFCANRVTKYSGNLWTNGGANNISLSTEWLEPFEGEY